MTARIEPGSEFRDNLAKLPPIIDVARIDLVDAAGCVIGSIENQPGKQGSLAVYNYLERVFGRLDREAAAHGLAIFAEHVPDARNRPGAHPNVDRLLAIAEGAEPLGITIVAADS